MLQNYTIRMAEETKIRLASLANLEGISQGQLIIKKIIENYSNEFPANSDITNANCISIPLEYKVFKEFKPSKKYNFSGKIFYQRSRLFTPVSQESINILKEHLKIRDDYIPMVCVYGFTIYIQANEHFLLHEIISMSSTEDTVSYLAQDVFIQRAIIKASLEDIIDIIKYYATMQDISSIKLLDGQCTSDVSVLGEYYS